MMCCKYDWNKVVICQFYSILYFDVDGQRILWMTDRKRYEITVLDFATLLDFEHNTPWRLRSTLIGLCARRRCSSCTLLESSPTLLLLRTSCQISTASIASSVLLWLLTLEMPLLVLNTSGTSSSTMLRRSHSTSLITS
jgi:hypothetical protein